MLIANGMFANKGFPIEEAFVGTNKANFHCESRRLDFSRPHEAADQINEWVSNKTKGGSRRPRISLVKQRVYIQFKLHGTKTHLFESQPFFWSF